ncbi:bifunctional aspartate transaminase/aspartate 4-decarboxylase [Ligilactobacillus sp. LYQ60]|uniref:bifunctional aspartate transaminase/aspartate 4-decarboxylase n=1 Tax=unclassified Ligilactobacillus TaxID=2767920 RepID=UPI0038542BE0
MDRVDEQQLAKLNAFEISKKINKLAQNNDHHNTSLNAGRGDPNWLNTKARLAFNRLVEFGITETRRTIDEHDLAGYTEAGGIAARFKRFLNPEERPNDKFLQSAVDYCVDELAANPDRLVKELTDGALGNNYPAPDRVLHYTERILNRYVQNVLYGGVNLENHTQIFPTEGGTAAIVYLFNSLKENHLIHPGDKIALTTPIFTPYLEIPVLNDYQLVKINLVADETTNWQIRPEELEKLADPNIKLVCAINPSNPGAKAFDKQALAAIKRAVAKNPDLMIVTDDVYGTFAENFQTIYSVVPYNTMLVYSFSKLFGATGWRLGLIAMHDDNVFDKLVSELPSAQRAEVNERYGNVVLHPDKMSFIERMVADSRSIGLYHTAGLSTPQQVMEDLFALTHLVAGKDDQYINESRRIVSERYNRLCTALGINPDESKENTKYYSLLDIYQIAEHKYGKGFRKYLEENFEQIDFLVNLAKKNGITLMNGPGFGTTPGKLRVSEANLPTHAYTVIGEQILQLLANYHERYEAAKKK